MWSNPSGFNALLFLREEKLFHYAKLGVDESAAVPQAGAIPCAALPVAFSRLCFVFSFSYKALVVCLCVGRETREEKRKEKATAIGLRNALRHLLIEGFMYAPHGAATASATATAVSYLRGRNIFKKRNSSIKIFRKNEEEK